VDGRMHERLPRKTENFEIHKNALRVNGSSEGSARWKLISSIAPTCEATLRDCAVGCGVSTAVCLQAAIDEGYTPRITCIEPIPPIFST